MCAAFFRLRMFCFSSTSFFYFLLLIFLCQLSLFEANDFMLNSVR
jgi:hypothetical protein